jgi:phage head maturation protease
VKLTGHFAVFNKWTEINSRFEGNFLERIAPGAMRRTIAENRSSIRALLEHGQDPMVELKPLGVVEELARIMGTSVTMIKAHYGVLLDTAHDALLERLEA